MLQIVGYIQHTGQFCWLQKLLHEMFLTMNLIRENSFMGQLFYIDEYLLLLLFVYQLK